MIRTRASVRRVVGRKVLAWSRDSSGWRSRKRTRAGDPSSNHDPGENFSLKLTTKLILLT